MYSLSAVALAGTVPVSRHTREPKFTQLIVTHITRATFLLLMVFAVLTQLARIRDGAPPKMRDQLNQGAGTWFA